MQQLAPTFRLLANLPCNAGRAISAPKLYTIASRTSVCSFHTSQVRYSLSPVTRPHLLSEFNLKDKVVVVSGGARGLGLVQAEALLEAGATGITICFVRIRPRLTISSPCN